MGSNDSASEPNFDPTDPFPIQDCSKSHSAAVDQWLGISAENVERGLLQNRTYSAHSKLDRELWIGTPVQTFQTPYFELRQILETLQPQAGETIVDLGAGYGRLAHVVTRHFPGVFFKGYEFVRERCLEGQAAMARAGLKLAQLENVDVTTLDFSKESAKYYFLYDFGSRVDVETTMENMKRCLSQHSIVVVARGGRSRDVIDKKHLWLSYSVSPLHRAHYSIYRSQPESNEMT